MKRLLCLLGRHVADWRGLRDAGMCGVYRVGIDLDAVVAEACK